MTIKIGGILFDKYNQTLVSLIYDSIASKFSFSLYFDPNNSEHRKALQPGLFPPVTIEHNGELLLTGTLTSYCFKSSAKKHLVSISGYSKTGVLEYCQIPRSLSLQSDNSSLTDIATKIVNVFGLKLVVDQTVKDVCSNAMTTINADATETVKDYLSAIAGQLNVVVSHTPQGELLLTGYKTKNITPSVITTIPPFDEALLGAPVRNVPGSITNKAAIINFTQGMPGVEFEQIFDGQNMHTDITVIGQSSFSGTNNAATEQSLNNPYVERSFDYMGNAFLNTIGSPKIAPLLGYRPKVVNQTTGTYTIIDKAQRNVLSAELKMLPLKIEIRGWNIGGKIVRPGDIITVQNPDLHIYSPARFFIESAEYRCNEKTAFKETCTLSCVVPETFNNDTPKNIFV